MSVLGSRIRAVACALALAGSFAGGSAQAMHANPWSPRAGGEGASFSLDASVGWLGGTATELAFDYPRGEKFKISELTWDFSEVAVAGVQGSIGFGQRFVASFGAWRALDQGDGMMVDRDWMYSYAIEKGYVDAADVTDEDWTHESRHPQTTLDDATLLDLNLAILAWRAGPFSVGGVVGYSADVWQWSARGGTYVYSVNAFRDRTGEFKGADGRNLRVIDYEQRWGLPYVGVTAAWQGAALQVEGHVLASTLVHATDTDYHVLRDTTFEGEFDGGRFFGFGFAASWNFPPRWRATLAAEYRIIDEITGEVTVIAPEGRAVYGGGGGVALEAAMVTLAAGYLF